MNKSLVNSSYQHLPGVDPENSEKGGWDTCLLASYIETFYRYENSIKTIIPREAMRGAPSRGVYNLVAREARVYHSSIARPA